MNKPLIKTSDGFIQCSTKGNLYFKNSVQEIHPKKVKATETKKTYIKITTKALLAKIVGISMFGYLVGIA